MNLRKQEINGVNGLLQNQLWTSSCNSLRLLSQQRGCSVSMSWRSPLPGIYSSLYLKRKQTSFLCNSLGWQSWIILCRLAFAFDKVLNWFAFVVQAAPSFPRDLGIRSHAGAPTFRTSCVHPVPCSVKKRAPLLGSKRRNGFVRLRRINTNPSLFHI